jgi:hypothetical protein
VGGDQPTALGEGVKIEDISLDDSRLMVHYLTRTSVRDCKAQAEEMPQVWDLVVKVRLKDSAVQRVVLFPEEASGRRQSVSFEFTKSTAGQWSVAVPCSIRISTG